MDSIKEKVESILNPTLEENHLFLVDLKINNSSGAIKVFIDKIPAITIDECVLVSRTLERKLNEEFNFSEKYSLEVSSPGLEQPFRVKNQYLQYIGRPVEIVVDEGKKITGNIDSLIENKLFVWIDTPKKSNKKQTESEKIEIAFDKIKSTKPYIKF